MVPRDLRALTASLGAPVFANDSHLAATSPSTYPFAPWCSHGACQGVLNAADY